MDEEHRRQEILQAEEAVRQLAQELARARQSRIDADEVAEKLRVVQGTLEQIRQSLEEAASALRQTADNAQSVLGEARTQLAIVERQVLRRWVWVSLVLSALAFGSALACLLLVLWAKTVETEPRRTGSGKELTPGIMYQDAADRAANAMDRVLFRR